jgi:simple sugar transport system permease protein
MYKVILEKRALPSKLRNFLTTLGAIIAALILGGIFISINGVNPFLAYGKIFLRVICSSYGLSEALVKMIPLIFTGLAVAVALENKVWNIGAEGQYLMGAFFVTAYVLHGPQLPAIINIPIIILISIIGGALWSLIPAFLKVKYVINEVITSLLMNYVALNIVDYFVYGPWLGPDNFPKTKLFPTTAQLPQIGFGRLHTGLFLALFCVILIYIVLKYSKFGYRIRLIGSSSKAGNYAGFHVNNTKFIVFLISGALAGIAGMNDLCGLQHRLLNTFSAGYGYTGIIVAWLSKSNPFIICFFAFFLSVIITGAEIIQISMGLPQSIGIILQGLLLFSILGAELFKNYKIKFIKD